MKRFQSLEEFEKKFVNEEVPESNLNKHTIMTNINNHHGKKRRISKSVKWVVIAMLISIIALPALSNGNLSYAEIYKNITESIYESIYGKVVATLPDTDGDGGFKLVETEMTEADIEMQEKLSNMAILEYVEEIKAKLEPGECARLVHLEFYEATGGSTYIVQQPIVFKGIDSLRNYGLDISIPNYIPKGYKLKEARLSFTPNDDGQDRTIADAMAEEARSKNLLYAWKRSEDKMECNLVIEYIPKRKADWDNSIFVEINLTDYDAATQALVFEGSDYEVEIVNIGDKEVMQWNYGSESPWKYYTFKVSDRKYKNYDILMAKYNPLSIKEIEKMIKSFD